MVLRRGGRIRGDVRPVEPDLSIANDGVRVSDVDLAVPHRLALAALKRDAGLDLVEQVVLEPRLSVRRDVAGSERPGRALPFAHDRGTRSMRPRGGSSPSIATVTGSVSFTVFPVRRPTSAVPRSLSSKKSP